MNVTPKTIGGLRTCDQKIMRFQFGTSPREFPCGKFAALNPPFRNFAKGWGTHTRAAKRFFVCNYIAAVFEVWVKFGCRTLALLARVRFLSHAAGLFEAARSVLI